MEGKEHIIHHITRGTGKQVNPVSTQKTKSIEYHITYIQTVSIQEVMSEFKPMLPVYPFRGYTRAPQVLRIQYTH